MSPKPPEVKITRPVVLPVEVKFDVNVPACSMILFPAVRLMVLDTAPVAVISPTMIMSAGEVRMIFPELDIGPTDVDPFVLMLKGLPEPPTVPII